MNIGVTAASLPLIANDEWYGMMSLHFDQVVAVCGDIRHVQGMVDEVAMGIQFHPAKTEARAAGSRKSQ
jgi:hypothetical protein